MIYYNEFDKYPAQWLRNLIAAGHLPDGVVDERDIREVQAHEVPDTAHFFAGIGGWPLALKLAGWEGPVWTGSCPCQPFSVAGKRGGTDDRRHLWPEWFRLIRERKPPVVFGEQVASRDGYAWFDLVQADLESLDYACGMVVSPAAGYGAPHIRHRIYFVAHAKRGATERHGLELASETRGNKAVGEVREGTQRVRLDVGNGLAVGEFADTLGPRLEERQSKSGDARQERPPPERSSGGELGDAESPDGGLSVFGGRPQEGGSESRGAGPTNGYWADAEWLSCTDGKARPTQPGLFPLVDGVPSRVGRLRAYGNAIVVPQAVEFVKAYMDINDLKIAEKQG